MSYTVMNLLRLNGISDSSVYPRRQTNLAMRTACNKDVNTAEPPMGATD